MEEEQTEGTIFVQTTLKLLGGKWKILILWHLKESTTHQTAIGSGAFAGCKYTFWTYSFTMRLVLK
jgi:hypothetical protein